MLGEVKAVRISAIHEPAIAGGDDSGEVQEHLLCLLHPQCCCELLATSSFCMVKAVLKNVIGKKYFT
jgi:hypothetical protein